MANQYKVHSLAQLIVNDGNPTTSSIQISGSMRIDWNKYMSKKGLLDCLDFGSRDVECNVPDPSLITIAGDIGGSGL
jgi:hypothetical protein